MVTKSKLILISVSFILLAFLNSCIGNKAFEQKGFLTSTTESTVSVVLNTVEVKNNLMIMTGSGLDTVTNVRMTNGAFDESFDVESQTERTLVVSGQDHISFDLDAVFNLFLTNAYGAAGFTITFAVTDGSITASKLGSMGADDGDVLIWDAVTSEWAPGPLRGLSYQGTWDADTNDPDIGGLDPGDLVAGYYYYVTVAGSENLDGVSSWLVGDWAIYNGTDWQKIDNSSLVTSVFGRGGAVTAVSGDYRWDQIDKAISSIHDIEDVNYVSSPAAGDVLMWDNVDEEWVPSSVVVATNMTDISPNSITTSDQAAIVIAPYAGGASDTGEIRFMGANNTNYAALRAAGDTTDDLTWTLPSTIGGSGHFLSTDGDGNLVWFGSSSGGAIGDFMTDGSSPMTGNLDLGTNKLVGTGGTDGLVINSLGNIGVGTSSPVDKLVVNGNVAVNAQGEIRLRDQDNSQYVGFKSAATLGASLMWTLPSTDGTPGYYLTSDGSETLSWGPLTLVDNMGASDGDVLKWSDGSSAWTPQNLNGLAYKGTWDADTNTPDISTLGPAAGDYYFVSVTGNTSLSGITDWVQSDWAMYSSSGGGVWEKIDNSNIVVSSVFGRIGAVVAQANDYTWAQIDKSTSSVNDINDVNTVGVAFGQVLKWDGAQWAIGDDTTGAGVANSVTTNEITDGTIVDTDISGSAAISMSKIDGLAASFAAKQDVIVGVVTGSGVDNSVALWNTASGIDESSITETQLNYLSSVTSDIQTQIDSKLNSADEDWDAIVGGINYAGGNVGIGATSPAATLAVSGGGSFSGDVTISGDVTMGGVLSFEFTSTPEAASSLGKLYVNSADSKLYYMDESGTESDLAGSNWGIRSVQVSTANVTPAIVGTLYLANSASELSFTLPATCEVGNLLEISSINSGGWKVLQQNPNHKIIVGSFSSLVGSSGLIRSTVSRQSVKLVCVEENDVWQVISGNENIGFCSSSGSQTFDFTGGPQSFVVPAGCTKINVKAWGAGGGGNLLGYEHGTGGGGGGYAISSLETTPAETLDVFVGQGGHANNEAAYSAYGGGGAGCSTTCFDYAGGGGGRSAIQRGVDDILTAGAGGGGQYEDQGGAGGGEIGQNGSTPNNFDTDDAKGFGGTLTAGGAGGSGDQGVGTAGTQYTGGTISSLTYVAGGGSGYYGGGAGGSDVQSYDGGGGGSSYVPEGGTTISGNGMIPGNHGDADRNGLAEGGISGSRGGNGRVIITWE